MDARLANFRNYRPLSTQAVLSHLADFGLEVGAWRERGLWGGWGVGVGVGGGGGSSLVLLAWLA
jgi:hypothetical protein